MHCIKDITIILPTKNESKNIANFLYSVSCDIKLIVVDASTDNTVDIIKEIKPKKIIHSLARCSLLYLDIMPDKWRGKD